jgi:electron transfer flavoprotein beta subunit
MKIIVCIKQVQYAYARTGMSPETLYFDSKDNIYRVNPHDEAALELALRLKDANANTTVSLLTLGPMIAEDEVKRCLAAGADDLYQVVVPGNSKGAPLDQPDPSVKSVLLSRAVKDLDGDLVLCGKESIDKANGQVAALMAQRLGLPFVSAITDLSLPKSGNTLQVQRSAGRGVREILECGSSAVFSVDLGTDLRIPKFDKRQWANAYKPKQLDYGTDVDAPRIVYKERFQPRPRPKIVPPPDSRLHAYDRVMQLLTGSNVEKTGEMLTGSLESQVDGLFSFLKDNGFLESADKD